MRTIELDRSVIFMYFTHLYALFSIFKNYKMLMTPLLPLKAVVIAGLIISCCLTKCVIFVCRLHIRGFSQFYYSTYF